jgi:hypothetical protein
LHQVQTDAESPVKKVRIALQGTEGLDDWSHNLATSLGLLRAQSIGEHPKLAEQASFKKFPGIPQEARVHKGFMDMSAGLIASIDAILDPMDFADDFDRIEVTGHSLGGATATLVGLYLQLKYSGSPVYVATFASPRIFDKVVGAPFVEGIMRRKLWRTYIYGDSVPAVPLGRQGFKHVGTPIPLSLKDVTRQTVNAMKRDAAAAAEGKGLAIESFFRTAIGAVRLAADNFTGIVKKYTLSIHSMDTYFNLVRHSLTSKKLYEVMQAGERDPYGNKLDKDLANPIGPVRPADE